MRTACRMLCGMACIMVCYVACSMDVMACCVVCIPSRHGMLRSMLCMAVASYVAYVLDTILHGMFTSYACMICLHGMLCGLHTVCGMCCMGYGNRYDKLPAKISATVVECESYSQTLETRRKTRSVAHLPLTCSFTLVEVGAAVDD